MYFTKKGIINLLKKKIKETLPTVIILTSMSIINILINIIIHNFNKTYK